MSADRNASIVECHQLGLGHAAIARDFGLSRERVRQIIKRELGESTPLKRQPQMRRTMALQALQDLEQGQSPQQVADELELSGDQLETILREQIGCSSPQVVFQGWMAQQLGRRFGHWIVLAIEPAEPESLSTVRCRVTARCELCGTVHRLGYRNLATGASTMCHRCGCRHRRQLTPIKDLLSGAIYPSLIAAAQAHGISYSEAQSDLRRKQRRFARITSPPAAPKPAAR